MESTFVWPWPRWKSWRNRTVSAPSASTPLQQHKPQTPGLLKRRRDKDKWIVWADVDDMASKRPVVKPKLQQQPGLLEWWKWSQSVTVTIFFFQAKKVLDTTVLNDWPTGKTVRRNGDHGSWNQLGHCDVVSVLFPEKAWSTQRCVWFLLWSEILRVYWPSAFSPQQRTVEKVQSWYPDGSLCAKKQPQQNLDVSRPSLMFVVANFFFLLGKRMKPVNSASGPD